MHGHHELTAPLGAVRVLHLLGVGADEHQQQCLLDILMSWAACVVTSEVTRACSLQPATPLETRMIRQLKTLQATHIPTPNFASH